MTITPLLLRYLTSKERRKATKQKYQRRIDMKIARSQKQKKSRPEVLNECTDTSYGAGVGLNAGIKKRQQHKRHAKIQTVWR